MIAVFRKIGAVAAAVLVGAGAGIAFTSAGDDEPSTTFVVGERPAGPDADAPSVEDLIAQLQVVDELPFVPGYDRGAFGTAWDDGRGTGGCDVRSNLLAAQLVDPILNTTTGCVIGGTLHDPYTGEIVDYQPGSGAVEADHVVPLLVAWRSGAAEWTQDRRVAFANDTEWNLLATSREANQNKRAATLGEWLPPNAAFQCEYAHNYLTVAVRYELPITTDDAATARTACTE